MDPAQEKALQRFDTELQAELVANGKCGRPRRGDGAGKLCRNRAGKGTSHVGKGACYLHGGLKKDGTDRRVRHLRYSNVSDVAVAEIMAELADDPNPLDVTPELQLARALLIDWTEKFGELKQGILAWNASRGKEERPAAVPDLTQLQPLLEAISRIVYRMQRAHSDKYIPRGKFYQVMMAMGRVIDSRVVDEELREQIKDDWLRIEIP